MKKSLAIAAVELTMMTGCQTSTSAQDFPLGPGVDMVNVFTGERYTT